MEDVKNENPTIVSNNSDHCRNVIFPTSFSRWIVLLLLFSLVFWIWAIYNTITGDYVDAGIVTFATVIASSVYLLVQSYRQLPPVVVPIISDGNNITSQSPRCSRISITNWLITTSHLLVVINYAGGAVIAASGKYDAGQGFIVYCIIFTFLWIGIAVCVRRGLYKLQHPVAMVIGRDQEEESVSQQQESRHQLEWSRNMVADDCENTMPPEETDLERQQEEWQ